MYHKTDVHIGRRVRERRLAMGVSQVERLGISFQQVQKYESGANRIGGSRLWDISRILQVPVGYFFEGLEEKEGAEPAGEPAESTSPTTLEVARAINSIRDENVRAHFVRLAKAFARAV